MPEAYKVKNIDFMNKLKNKINELNYNAYAEKDFNESFEKTFKYLLFDDLNTFLKNEYENSKIPYLPDYFYNYNISNPDVMFITTTNHDEEIKLLKSIIKKLGITNYYITSYYKTNKIDYINIQNSSLDSVLDNEIKNIKAKNIIFFGNRSCGGLSNINKLDKHIYMNCNNYNFIITSSLLDIISSVSGDKDKLILKNLIWKDLKSIGL